MGCVVKPKNHQLWDELFEYLGQNNRKLVKYWYTVAHDQEFLNMARDVLEFNSEGEPTFASLMRAAGTSEYAEKIKYKLGEQLGVGEMTYDEAIEKLQSFNRSTPFKQEYMATITPSGGKVRLSIVEKTAANQKNLRKFINQRSLQDRIKYYLKIAGVDYAFLEEGSTEYGRYSTENVERTASGLAILIKIANGEHVTSSLAEEAGHFAVGALGNSPLVKRLLAQLDDTTMRAILGEEYERKNLGKNPQREVAGYLVGQAILNNVDTTSAVGRLVSRILNAVKKIFAKMRKDTVEQARLEAKSIADKIARSFMSEDFDGSVDTALEKVETLYSKNKSGAEQLFNRFQTRFKEIQIQLKAFYPEKAKDFQLIMDEMEAGANWGDTFATESAMIGLARAMISLSNMAEEIQTIFQHIDDDFSDDITFWDHFYKNGKNLKYCNEYCLAVAGILKEFDNFTSQSSARKDSDRLPSDLNVDMFNTDGRILVNLKTLADNLNVLLRGGSIRTDHEDGRATYTECRGLFQDVQARKVDFFTKFCEVSLGRNYIIRAKRVLFRGLRPVKVPAEKYTIRRMIDELEDDTTIMGKLFGSLGNSSDVISQIVFKAYKTAQKRAHNEVIQVQDTLRNLIKDARKLGVQNERIYCARVEEDYSMQYLADKIGIDDITEEDGHYVTYFDSPNGKVKFVFKDYPKKGSLTGNIASLYDEARYEWEYDEFKRYFTAKFKAQNPSLDPSSNRFLIEWQEEFKSERNKFLSKTHHYETIDGESVSVLNDEYISKEYAKTFLKIDTSKSEWKASAKIKDKEENVSPEKEILNRWLAIKAELDSKLPMGSIPLHRLPQFRGGFLDRLKNEFKAGNDLLSATAKIQLNRIHETFAYDTSQGDYGSDLTYTFEDEQLSPNPLALMSETVNRIPLYGINRLDDMSKLSTDIFGSMVAYAAMACNYNAMDYISHALEIGKSVLGEHRKLVTKNGDLIKPKSNNKFKKFYNKIFHNYELQLREEDRNLKSGLTVEEIGKATGSILNVYGKYALFLDKQLYGHYLSGFLYPGSVLIRKGLYKISKWFNIVNGLSSIMALGGSVTVAGVSLGDGVLQILNEAHAGEYFNQTDILKANFEFLRYMFPNWCTYFGVRFTSTKYRADKMTMLIRQLNMDENNLERFRSWNTKNRLYLGELLNDAAYLPMEAGTVYMNVIPYIALMMKKTLYTRDGRKRSLWDAYRVSTSEFEGSPTRRLVLDDIYFTSKEKADTYNLLEEELDYVDEIINQISDMIDSEAEEYLKSINHTIPKEVIDYFKNKGRNMVDDEGFLNVTTRQELNRWKNALEEQMNTVLKYNEQDEADFMAEARQLVNHMHGIYDRDNKGTISQSLIGQMWSCMKGYMFGMIAKAFTGNRYNIFHERETNETFTDENGVTVPLIDGEMEGYVLSTVKSLLLILGNPGHWGVNYLKLLGVSLLACFPGKSGKDAWGTKFFQDMGMSMNGYANYRRMAATILIGIGLGLLIDMLKGYKDDEDEQLANGNPYTKINLSDIDNDSAKEMVNKLSELWEKGVDPNTNYFELLLKHPEIFKNKKELEKVKKLAKIYNDGRNRTCNDERIDWAGLGIYFLTRCQRDNNAFVSPSALFGDKESPTTQEIRGASSIIGSTISIGMMGSLFEVAKLAYGDLKYGDLQDQKLAFLNRVKEYQKYRKDNNMKYISKKDIIEIIMSTYNKNGTVISPFFDEDKEFLSFMRDHKEEYDNIKELDKNLLNKYYSASNTAKMRKGEAKWRSRGKSLIPWVKAEFLLYHPEESLKSYMFAVRNQ